MIFLSILLIATASYVIGSFPTGYVIVKEKTGKDLREIGSGSTGATNVKRVLGTKWFIIVMLADAWKGAFPVLLAKNFIIDPFFMYPIIASVAVIIGHSKSCFLDFKGGKSVASAFGTILALNPIVGILLAAVWGVITYFSKYVSLGSVIAVLLSPLLMWLFHMPVLYIAYCAVGAVYITYLHRENIVRLINGNENKVR